MLDRAYGVYIIASKRRTIYTGMTGHLRRRIWEHKTGVRKGFTSGYNCDSLVLAEMFDDPVEAIAREKQIKGWLRKRKTDLIEVENPLWTDLAEDWFDVEEIEAMRRGNLPLRYPEPE